MTISFMSRCLFLNLAEDHRADLETIRCRGARLMSRRVFIFLVTISLCFSRAQADGTHWSGNKVTPDQPFPAKVCAVAPSWVGDHLLLEEIGGTHRLCIARLWLNAPLEYLILDAAKGETPEYPQRTEGWTYITPGIEVNRFSWSIGIAKLGKNFGNEDMLQKGPKPKESPTN